MVYEMIELLTRAFWITLTAYVIFIIGRWIYKKYIKPDPDTYFYFLSLKMKTKGEWYLRIESPSDDFKLDVSVLDFEEIVLQKNTRLKAGINSILLLVDTDDNRKEYTLQLKSEGQSLERKFAEAED